MRIVIIGGTGFIGPAVVRRLHGQGHELMLFHRGQSEPDELPDVPHLHGERAHLANYTDEFGRFAPDVVLDMFPYTEGDARTVVGVFSDLAQRAVALSSMDVYRAFGRVNHIEAGPVEPVPLTEEAPLRHRLYPYRDRIAGLSEYDKILVERVFLGAPDLPATILRLPFVYGPGDPQHRLFPYLKRMDDDRPAILLDEGMARHRATRGDVLDVAAAIALAATDDRAMGHVYNVGEAHSYAELEWVRRLGRVVGWTGKIVVVPREQLPEALRWWGDANTDQHMVADTTRIRTELAYAEPTDQDEALRQAIEWERAHPPRTVNPTQIDYAAEDAILAAQGQEL